jgi:hypothetical protein
MTEQLREVRAEEEIVGAFGALEMRFAAGVERALVQARVGVGIEPRLALGVDVDHRADEAQRTRVVVVEPDAAEGARPAVGVVLVEVAHVVAEGTAAF